MNAFVNTPADRSQNWKMTLDELAHGSKGKIIATHATEFSGVGTDTRADLRGKIFVALKGDSFDAHDFLSKAVDAGASALLVHRLPKESESLRDRVSIVEVADTLVGIQKLANFWRRKMRAAGVKFLGITGTNGKTTSKEFSASVLGAKFEVQYSKGSFNNHWGVPISILSVDSSYEVAVIEMGMNHLGELTLLSEIVEPDAVVCTMVGRGHLEGVNSIEGVAKAKSEIYEHAPKDAVMIFNLENEQTRAMHSRFSKNKTSAQVVTFAELGFARTHGLMNASPAARTLAGSEAWPKLDVAFEVISATVDSLHVRGEIRGVGGETTVPVFGRQNVTNLMVAATLGLVSGMTPEEIWKALPLCKNAWGRNQWVRLETGARVLFDAYNANPESMTAAVQNFAQLSAQNGRKIAVLAEMRELGQHTSTLHKELGQAVAKAGFDIVCFVGPSEADFSAGVEAAGFSKTLFVSKAYEQNLAARMLPVLNENDIVLFKGSRGMELEKVLAELKPLDFQPKK